MSNLLAFTAIKTSYYALLATVCEVSLLGDGNDYACDGKQT